MIVDDFLPFIFSIYIYTIYIYTIYIHIFAIYIYVYAFPSGADVHPKFGWGFKFSCFGVGLVFI